MASYPTVSDSNSLVKLYHPPYVSLVASANWKNFPVVPVGRDWLTLPGARRRARAAPISPLPVQIFPKYAPCLYSATVNDASQRPEIEPSDLCSRTVTDLYRYFSYLYRYLLVPTDGDSFLECVNRCS